MDANVNITLVAQISKVDLLRSWLLDISEKECRDVALLRLYKGSG